MAKKNPRGDVTQTETFFFSLNPFIRRAGPPTIVLHQRVFYVRLRNFFVMVRIKWVCINVDNLNADLMIVPSYFFSCHIY